MLYTFYGSDLAKSLAKARSLANSLRAKRPDAEYVSIDTDHWDEAALEGHLSGQGLFSNKYIVFLDRVSERPDACESLEKFLQPMKESANIFIVLEGKLLVDMKKSVEKHANKTVVSDVEAARAGAGAFPRGEFNVFALADAIATRDRLKAWVTYRQAVDTGLEPENIIGTLFWQAKSIAVAGRSTSAPESGLTPFVYGKAKRAAGRFSSDEQAKLMASLISIYHDSHRGLVDAELAMERWCLML